MRWMAVLLLAGCGSPSIPPLPEDCGIDGWTARLLVVPRRGSTEVKVTFRNVSNRPNPIVPVERWDEILPGLSSSQKGQARLEIRQESGRLPDSFLEGWGPWHRPPQPEPIVLEPGDERTYEWKGHLGPGTYTVEVIYSFAWDEDGIRALEAGPVRFSVPE